MASPSDPRSGRRATGSAPASGSSRAPSRAGAARSRRQSPARARRARFHPSERYSTGYPAGAHSIPSSRARFFAGPSSEPGTAIPETSPFTSAAKTATPAAESCSAMTCSVLVLPVPVAPAIRPCRFIILSGTRTAASGTSAPSCTPTPSSIAAPAGRVCPGDRRAEIHCLRRSGGHRRDRIRRLSTRRFSRPVYPAACVLDPKRAGSA